VVVREFKSNEAFNLGRNQKEVKHLIRCTFGSVERGREDLVGLRRPRLPPAGRTGYLQRGVERSAVLSAGTRRRKPNGWQRRLQTAVKWLESRQADGGYWVEPSLPDPTYLTVLVLDALELARTGEPVTFGRGTVRNSESENRFPARFSVALSFPGESRAIVEEVAQVLGAKLGTERVFYDKNFEAILARPGLDVYHQDIHPRSSELVVVWLSGDYQKKEWCCNVEWPAIRDILKQRRDQGGIMFLRLDDGKVEGFLSIDGYVDVRGWSAAEIAKLILQRPDHNRKQAGPIPTPSPQLPKKKRINIHKLLNLLGNGFPRRPPGPSVYSFVIMEDGVFFSYLLSRATAQGPGR
jgi:hypothetical protein